MTCSGVEPGNIFKGLTVSNANVTSFELFYTTYIKRIPTQCLKLQL